MKKADSGEFYNINQYNDFSEYQPFSAEIYYSQESQKPPVESQSYDESFEDDGGKPTGGSEESSTDLDDIQKEYDKINQSENSGSADSSAPSNPLQTATSTSSGGASASSGSAAQAGGAVSGSAAGAAGAGAGATAVAAVVIVSAVVTGGFLTDVGKHVEYNTGTDYVAITVDMDEILSETDKSYSLTADNFYLQFDKDGTPLTVSLINGKHSYLVTGLQPEKSYTYSLMCSNPPLGSNSSCYSQTVSTSGSGEPSAVWDELNNYITYDQTTQTASVYYSVYLSDYAKALSGATLYLCSSEQTDFSHVTQVIYSSEELDDNNFFKGSADGITYEQLYLYVVAQPSAGAEATCLLSHKIEVGLPEEWVNDAMPAFVADESAEEITCQPDSITVSGKITNLNNNYNYFAYVTQYNVDGTAPEDAQEAALSIDPENMTYSVNAEAYYGVNTFKYVIYTYDGDENEVVVYDSGEKQFTASQAFGATYTKVEPTDATIEYGESNVTITVDPQFTSEYGNYEYKLVVTNSAGEVYGQYQGTGEAVIDIEDYVGLDQINFTYYDIGTFADGEREFASHTTTPVTGNAYFVADESAEEIACQPDSITVSGKITNLNNNYNYFAYVTQYNSDGTALVERQEAGLITDPENMTYSVNAEAYYGVNTFKYVIYTYDGDENEVVVYDSGERQFTASQAFGATYTKVEPTDATIEYGASNVIITVDPQFTSEYGNYEYKLVVTNSAGEVYGQYQGTGEAVIDIEDYVGLDRINFTYYDIGTFADGEREFASHTTTPVTGNAYFAVDESAEEITCQPDSITVSGKIINLNNNYNYFAYVTQYNSDGTAPEDAQECAFSIDTENMTYTVESWTYYGVNTFKYVIYTYDGDENEVVVYDSGERQFTASQAFGATYTKVEPTDATIEYGASNVIITVDPQFTSEYGNYEYKLVVTNSAGEVYGQYQGTGEAVIDIEDYVGLDRINFTYYDIGTFADGEVEFASHTTTGVDFCVPTLSLGSEYGFDGQYFTLSYACDMIYDYAQASMDIEVTDGDGNSYTRHIAGVAESGTITLDFVTGEPGSATVKVTLNFTDNQSDGAERSLAAAQADYTMNYAFEVTKVVADVSGYSAETLQVDLNFDYQLPTGYLIKITDETNAIDLTLDLTKQYSISDLAMDADYNLTVQVTDADGNNWGEAKAVTVSKSAAEAEYTDELSIDHPSPTAAVVTYNDDGTINIYREMIPSSYGRDTISDDERVYYNAVVCSGYYDDEYNFIETDRYDVIGRGRFAVIENIPLQNYLFIYYQMFDYNGVSYIMYGETPSGMVECVYSDSDEDGYEDFASAGVLCADGQTTISVNVWSSGNLDNKITVNGTEYTYTTYTDEYETAPTLVIDGEIEVSEVTVYFTKQSYNYDTFAEYSDLTMKGSKFVGHVVLVTPTEA